MQFKFSDHGGFAVNKFEL